MAAACQGEHGVDCTRTVPPPGDHGAWRQLEDKIFEFGPPFERRIVLLCQISTGLEHLHGEQREPPRLKPLADLRDKAGFDRARPQKHKRCLPIRCACHKSMVCLNGTAGTADGQWKNPPAAMKAHDEGAADG